MAMVVVAYGLEKLGPFGNVTPVVWTIAFIVLGAVAVFVRLGIAKRPQTPPADASAKDEALRSIAENALRRTAKR